jgi:alanine racemase
MDMITADITDQASLNVGDRIVLWGSNPSVDTIARHCSTIGYELCTRITERVPRQFNPIGSDVD